MRQEDLIWNRGCEVGDEAGLAVGDVHLRRLIRGHSDVMNGGMEAAHDRLTVADKRGAADASRYFGASGLGAVFDALEPAEISEDELEELEDRYYDLVPDDESVVALFEAKLEQSPTDFAPV